MKIEDWRLEMLDSPSMMRQRLRDALGRIENVQADDFVMSRAAAMEKSEIDFGASGYLAKHQ